MDEETQMSLRCTVQQLRGYTRAAEACGLKMSVWAKLVLDAASGQGGDFGEQLKRAQQRAPWSVRLDD